MIYEIFIIQKNLKINKYNKMLNIVNKYFCKNEKKASSD